ncbi:MAG TPA: YbaB/EbfC family nucleoid-associated protein [Gemmataceae bacterium]|nr:YbaB/EbfC family nucleoid-associated protein [Gemmataceae bacterium]
MNPFKQFGQMANLLQQLPKIREEMERLQQRLGQLVAEGDAGAGMVKVRVNGKLEMLSCSVSEELFRQNDREMLEDLIRSATNQALERARQQAAEETGKMAAGFGLPSGLGLPGMPS